MGDENATDGTLRITFGRYKGKTIEELPSDYLKFIRAQFDDDRLVQAAGDEIAFRERWNTI